MPVRDPVVLSIVVVAAGYTLLVLTSGWVVRTALSWADEEYAGSVTSVQRDIGTIVGKCENVLLFTLVLVEAFTALALVFAAKSLVRREDMERNSLYYLAGTLVNVTYSLLVGLVVLALLSLGVLP